MADGRDGTGDDQLSPDLASRIERSVPDVRRATAGIYLVCGDDATTRRAIAERIATRLGRRLAFEASHRKYIGETEKNLVRLLEASQAPDVVLFFDEADALFGRRTGVSDAGDRRSKSEATRLFTNLREKHGPLILGTTRCTSLPDQIRSFIDEVFAV